MLLEKPGNRSYWNDNFGHTRMFFEYVLCPSVFVADFIEFAGVVVVVPMDFIEAYWLFDCLSGCGGIGQLHASDSMFFAVGTWAVCYWIRHSEKRVQNAGVFCFEYLALRFVVPAGYVYHFDTDV